MQIFPFFHNLAILLSWLIGNNNNNDNNNNALLALTTKRHIYMASDKLQ